MQSIELGFIHRQLLVDFAERPLSREQDERVMAMIKAMMGMISSKFQPATWAAHKAILENAMTTLTQEGVNTQIIRLRLHQAFRDYGLKVEDPVEVVDVVQSFGRAV